MTPGKCLVACHDLNQDKRYGFVDVNTILERNIAVGITFI